MIIIPWLFHHCLLIYHCFSVTYILCSLVDSSLVCPLCPSSPYCSALTQYYVDVGPLLALSLSISLSLLRSLLLCGGLRGSLDLS
ncbi:hypothetical protein K435DRAFT_445036 [Dendrothele bispora CBS 962.96]|uniref:Uncharacterized protein n=1 Tax=Dendrothele bispora (strain CBS 962.96) TaxID=1314807 RepID=A0A4S8L2G2_DENBC|nr:hypothetical protein K435DRAFT_445036 [Dendrothele bispora CBS 962.96]